MAMSSGVCQLCNQPLPFYHPSTAHSLTRGTNARQQRSHINPLASSKARKPFLDSNDPSDAVQKAIRLAEGRKTGPVRPEEAAKGKLDFVQVKDWGSGEPEDVGSLQVNSFSSDRVVDDGQPLYVLLARQLEALEAKGALQAAQPPGSRALPPFERWSMAASRYIQFMIDLCHVHKALEAAIASAPAAAMAKQYDDHDACRPALQVLQRYSRGIGLRRSTQIEADLAAMTACSWLPDAHSIQPSGHALALGQALQTLQNTCSRSDARGWLKAALRLLAYAYCINVTNLSMGTRIGSSAAEKLNLFNAHATHTWRSFPEIPGRNPVVTFAETVNAAGAMLQQQHRQILSDELAPAMIRTSMLLQTLAYED